MTTRNQDPTRKLQTLRRFVTADHTQLNACFDQVEHTETISGITCATRMFHLKFSGNGEPQIAQLCDCLFNHVIDFCLSARSRPARLNSHEAAKYTQKARRLFTRKAFSEDDPDKTGQAGEILLYFLLETLFEAPQLVAKMELKTNPNFEIFGSDGIHAKWNIEEQLVELYFGEAKIYQQVGAAITNAIKSIEQFHDNDMCRHECSLVTAHFKYADLKTQEVITKLLDNRLPGVGVRINHACLIGYDWMEYRKLPNGLTVNALTDEFRMRYQRDAPRLHRLLQEKLYRFEKKHLNLHVVFLPFRSVQEFRDEFNKAIE